MHMNSKIVPEQHTQQYKKCDAGHFDPFHLEHSMGLYQII